MPHARVALLPSATLVLGALAGCVTPALDAADPVARASADAATSAAEVAAFTWDGRILVGAAAEILSHQGPTEGVLWPAQKVGFAAEIPEGVTAIEVALDWTGDTDLIIMLHSHDHSGGPNDIIMHRSERGSPDPHCLRVPTADVAPGKWELMARSSVDDAALDVEFTLTLLTQGGSATLLDERHGHDRLADLQNGRSDDEREVEPCALWSPPAKPGVE